MFFCFGRIFTEEAVVIAFGFDNKMVEVYKVHDTRTMILLGVKVMRLFRGTNTNFWCKDVGLHTHIHTHTITGNLLVYLLVVNA